MGWKITWGDNSWTESDLLVGHVAAIMQLQGVDDWAFCNALGGPLKLMGVLAVLVGHHTHVPPAEVLAELAAVPAVDLVAALSVEPDVAPVPEVVTEPVEE